MRRAFSLISITCLGMGGIASTSLGASPTTRPAGDRIAALVHQMGDSHYRVRSEASISLHDMGSAALPALRLAINDNDPEVRLRAARLLRVLEFRHVPGRPLHHNHERRCNITNTVGAGKREIAVDDEGRTIKITDQNGSDIEMTVTGYRDGRPATETYKAADAMELRESNPEAYAVYLRWASGAAMGTSGLAANNVLVQPNGNVVLVPPMQAVVPGLQGDDVNGLAARLEDQMKEAGLSDASKQLVRDALKDVQDAGLENSGPVDEINQEMRNYDQSCDHLRKVLGDLHLPDPGDALPPPRRARLGISVQPDQFSNGLAVSHVATDSRADRLGLQEDDAIRTVNGQPACTAQQLRQLVTKHYKGLILGITRDGRDMTLREPGAARS